MIRPSQPGFSQAERAAGGPEAGKRALTETLADCLFLGLVVLLSFALYAPRLGFYSDDWVFLELLHSANTSRFVDLVAALFIGDRVIQQRPVQVVYLAGLYDLFGLNPAPYHWVNGAVFIANAVLLYLVLRRLGLPRLIGLSVPLVYVLLPNYATDRFWPAAHQAPLSIAFYLLSLYSLLSAQVARRRAAWLICAALAAAASVLAYEVTLPLLLLNPLLVWYAGKHGRQRDGGPGDPSHPLGAGVLAAVTLFPLAAALAYKLTVTVRINVQGGYLAHLLSVYGGAVRLNFIVYGAALPYVVWWIAVHALDWRAGVAAGLVAVLAAFYLYRVASAAEERGFPSSRTLLALVAAGLFVFLLGYAIFAISADISFEPASLANRVGIAAALGVALTFAGIAGLVSRAARRPRLRTVIFSLLIASLCATGALINNTLGRFWEEAYVGQQNLLSGVKRQVAELPARSTLLVDGICLEHRGAYLLTGQRDLQSILRIYYPAARLEARALSHRLDLQPGGVRFFTNRESVTFPYSDTLFVYSHADGALHRLDSAAAARDYLASHTFDPDRDCALGFAWGWERR